MVIHSLVRLLGAFVAWEAPYVAYGMTVMWVDLTVAGKMPLAGPDQKRSLAFDADSQRRFESGFPRQSASRQFNVDLTRSLQPPVDQTNERDLSHRISTASVTR